VNPLGNKPSIFKGFFSGDDSKGENSEKPLIIPTRPSRPDPYSVRLSETSTNNNYSNLLTPDTNGLSEDERLALDSLASVPIPEEMNFDHYLNNPDLRGWLRKKTGTNKFGFSIGDMTTSNYGWKRYWFCVKDTRLMYYTNEQSPNTQSKGNPPTGIISLQFATSIQVFGKKSIKICFPEVTYELEAAEISHRSKWVKGLLDVKTTYVKLQQHTGASSPFGINQTDMRKEGALELRSGNNWKPRYVVLVDGMLLIFSAKGALRNHRIPLYDLEMDAVQATDNSRFSFKIRLRVGEEPKEMEFGNTSESVVESWVEILRKHKLLIEDFINTFTF
jgi:hypothetical protein